MSTSGIFVLTAIIIAFLIFGMILAWGDRQTRNLIAAGKSEKKGAQEVANTLIRSAKAVATAGNSVGDHKMAKN
jgi:lipopolysaccharide export LptBFGC system permease protein LptF